MRFTAHESPDPERDESNAPGQDTQANRVPQPYAALANARAHNFRVKLASDAEIHDVWRQMRGPQSMPLGRLLVIASVNNYGRERLLWLARSASVSSAPHFHLLGRAIERAVQSELRDVTCGAVILLERHGQLITVPYIYRHYSASPSKTLVLTVLSWCCVSLMSIALFLVQRPQRVLRREGIRSSRRLRRRTPLPLTGARRVEILHRNRTIA